MTAVGIKTAAKALLDAHLGTAGSGQLKTIVTQYPKIAARAKGPWAILWDAPGTHERLLAGGNIASPVGLKERRYRIQTHLIYWGNNPDVDGATFDTLLSDVQALYRAHPWLDGSANTPSSFIFEFALDMQADRKPQPRSALEWLVYEAVITCNAREGINA